MHETQRVAKNALLMLAKQGVMAVLSVVFVGFLARSVGVAAYGELQASLALCAMASIIAGLGVRGYVAREIAVRPELGPRHLGSALMIRGVTGAIVLSLVATVTCSMHPGEEARWLVPVAAASQLATLLYTTMWLSFEAHERFQYILYVELGARLFVLACASICVAAGLGIISAAIVFAGGNVIELVLTYYFLKSRLYAPRLSADFLELVSVAKQSLPIGAVGALLGAVRQSDRVLLRWFGDETAVGIFSAGYVLVEQLEVLSDLVFGAAFAAGMRLHARDRAGFCELYTKAFIVAVALGLPMAVGVYLLAPDIIQVVYGREFVGAAYALRILAWHVPVTFVFHVAAMPLLAGKREVHLGAVLLPALVAVVGLDWLLVPSYGALGAAATALVVAVAIVVASMAITPSFVRVIPLRRVRSAIIATALMAAVVHFVRDAFGVWAAIVAGASTHVLLLLAFRVVTMVEIRTLVRPATPQFHSDEHTKKLQANAHKYLAGERA